MGLDISVYKPVKRMFSKNDDDYYMISDNPELSFFKEFIVEKVISFNDFESVLKICNLTEDDVEFEGIEGCEEGIVYIAKDKKTKKEIRIINPITYPKKEKCIFVEEVGYQRKGANKKFYDDNMWGGYPCIVDKKILLDHWIKYFSDTEDMKYQFKTNIIDKFIEGETFVIYH